MTFNEVATAPRFGVDLSALKAAGQYKVEATLFGTTRLGREVQLQLPAKSFTIAPPPPIWMSCTLCGHAHIRRHPRPVRGAGESGLAALGAGEVACAALAGAVVSFCCKSAALCKGDGGAEGATAPEETPATPKLDLNLPEQ